MCVTYAIMEYLLHARVWFLEKCPQKKVVSLGIDDLPPFLSGTFWKFRTSIPVAAIYRNEGERSLITIFKRNIARLFKVINII